MVTRKGNSGCRAEGVAIGVEGNTSSQGISFQTCEAKTDGPASAGLFWPFKEKALHAA